MKLADILADNPDEEATADHVRMLCSVWESWNPLDHVQDVGPEGYLVTSYNAQTGLKKMKRITYSL